MEGQVQSGSRRTRFTDDTELENLSDDNASDDFGNDVTIPTFAVLHDALPNLGNRCKDPTVRIADPTPTLANLTAEFNDLSRKMTLLKETIKASRSNSAPQKAGPIQINSSSQASQASNITGVATAKLVLHDCIAELISVNNFLDGNEEIAAVYREKLRRAISDKYVKAEAVIIQGISLSPNTYNPIPRGGKLIDDSSFGEYHNFLSRQKNEAEVQTEAKQTVVAEASTEKSSTQPPDTNVSPDRIAETTRKPKRTSWKNNRK